MGGRACFTADFYWDGPDRNKIEPHAWAFGTNFLSQFEPVIRNPDDRELSSLFCPVLWIIQDVETPVRSNAYFPECMETGLKV